MRNTFSKKMFINQIESENRNFNKLRGKILLTAAFNKFHYEM